MFSAILSGKHPAEAKGKNADYGIKPVLLQVTPESTKKDVISWFKQLCAKNKINPDSNSVAILTRGKIYSNTEIPELWQTPETHLFASATYLWHCASRKKAYLQCERALFDIMIGDANGLSTEDIRQAIENIMDYSSWKHKVILILSLLPKANLALKDWKKQLIEIIEKLNQQKIISIFDSRKISDIIKLKTRVKVNSSFSTEFLDKPLYMYFQKRTIKGTTFSSVHGVKGESFDATLLMVEGKSGNTITPHLLNKGNLDSELMRIAYVAMTRPRKLLAVSIPKQKAKNALNRFPPELWDYQEL
jgi:hypothetical protein